MKRQLKAERFGKCLLLTAISLILAMQCGCVAVGYSSGGGWFIWPGGFVVLLVIVVFWLLLRRRG